MKKDLDTIDKELVSRLSQDGRLSAGKIGEQLKVSTPTVRSRLKALMNSGAFKISGLIDSFKTRGITTALVGIRLDTYNLNEKLEEISNLDHVHWAAVVTGRYDVIADIVSTDGTRGLNDFLTEKLYKVGGIKSSEAFVVMKAKRKWVLLPPGIRKKLVNTLLTIEKD